MINQLKYKDFMIIDGQGNIIFGDVGNPQYFDVSMDSVTGKSLSQLYVNLDQDYPALQAAREGTATDHFEIEVTTVRGLSLTKVGCAYPICENGEPIASLEFSDLLYDKKHIREIEDYAEHLIYRRNNTKYILEDIITEDPAMLLIKERIEKLAITNSTVLLYGQTGTGKELIAQALHNGSRRYSKKFISVNCGAIPGSVMEGLLFGTTKGSFTGAEDKPGLFEQAEGGTLFLDEINSLNPLLQVKLLKAVESKTVRRIGALKEKKVNVRIIAATNEEPRKLIQEGRLMPDLFYRLAVIYLRLPCLSERSGDIMVLADHFRTYFNKKMNLNIEPFDEDIQSLFVSYDWPGNVRELRNVIEGAFAFAENNRITMKEIPKYIINKCGIKSQPRYMHAGESGLPLSERSDLIERAIIANMYKMHGGNLTETAKALGISKQLLRYKMSKYEGGSNGNQKKL